MKDKVLDAVKNNGEATLKDIYAEAQGHSRPSVRGTVYKMVNAGALEKTPEGKYRLKESGGAEPTGDQADEPAREPTGNESAQGEPEAEESGAGEPDTEPGGDESAGAESRAAEPTGEPTGNESAQGEPEAEESGAGESDSAEESGEAGGDEPGRAAEEDTTTPEGESEEPEESDSGREDESARKEPESWESDSAEAPDDEAEKLTADEALAEALEKFAGLETRERRGGQQPPKRSKMQRRKGLLPTAGEARWKLQADYVRLDGFSDGGVSPDELWAEQKHRIRAVILQGPASLGLKPRFRLPDALVQDGREARKEAVTDGTNAYLLKHLLNALRDIGVKNTKRLRNMLRFDTRKRALYAFTVRSEVVVVVGEMGIEDPYVKYKLRRIY